MGIRTLVDLCKNDIKEQVVLMFRFMQLQYNNIKRLKLCLPHVLVNFRYIQGEKLHELPCSIFNICMFIQL